jgi:uncharacterized phage protein (TIGR01671 family)
MRRKFKFRVWDTKLQKMMSWNPFIRFDDSEYVVQQFTGLSDKNGREIYEGDIVTEKPLSDKPPHYKVVWDNDLAMFCLANLKSGKLLEDWEGNIANMIPENIRVICNIF